MRAQSVPGVNIVLLRDPVEALQSYFVIAFRNGDNMTILTDRDKSPHPLYNRMARRPDRDLERRAAMHWFPYDLLSIKVTEDQRQLYATARSALVPIDAKGVKLKALVDLDASSFVWLVLLADLIRERFWERGEHLPALSYTAEMVRSPEALVGSAGSLIVHGSYKPLSLPPVLASDLTPEALADQWQHKPTGCNHWLVERYGAEVPVEVMNVLGSGEAERVAGLLPQPEERGATLSERERRLVLHTVEPTTFGTSKSLQRDRIWSGRFNQAKAVSALAQREFDREKANVVAWYDAAVRRNARALLDAVARGTLVLPAARSGPGMDRELEDKPLESLAQAAGNASDTFYTVFERKYASASGWLIRGVRLNAEHNADVILGSWHVPSGGYDCFLNETRASVLSVFFPTCPAALAALAGVEEQDLHWALKHWFRDESYRGNPILDRLDPEDWVIKNPWQKLHFRVGVALSRRAFNERRKHLGLPPKKWPE